MFLIRLLVLALLPSFALASDCVRPEAPASVPDGATAGEEAMIEASQLVKSFVEDGQAYTDCLQPQLDDAKALATNAAGKEQLVKLTEMHDSMVDEMQATANAFNMSVKAYKSR